jgi:hypothetical protein
LLFYRRLLGDEPLGMPSTKFECFIKLKPVKSLGFIIPLTLLFQAKEVLQEAMGT